MTKVITLIMTRTELKTGLMLGFYLVFVCKDIKKCSYHHNFIKNNYTLLNFKHKKNPNERAFIGVSGVYSIQIIELKQII